MSAPLLQGKSGLGRIKLPGPDNLTLEDLAIANPRAALAMLGGPGAAAELFRRTGVIDAALLGGWCCGWGWEILDVKACFTTPACGQVVQGKFCLTTGDMLIRKVTVTVERPNAFPGNIFKAQSDFFNSQNPNIHAQLEIISWCKYVISEDFTPLQNIPIIFDCACPLDFTLRCNATIIGRFINKRAFAPQELPVEVTVSFHAIRLPVPIDTCSYADAVGFFSRFGVLAGIPELEQPPMGELRGGPAGELPGGR